MKKSTLLMIVSVVLAMTLSLGGTLAYLQDSDSDVNVMTLGNVYIEQHEYERKLENGTYKTDTFDGQNSYVLKEFTQGKPLLPIVGDPSVSRESPAYAGWDETIVRMKQVNSYGGMQVFAGKNAVDKFVTIENTGSSDAYVRTFVAIEVGNGKADLIGTSYHKCWEEKGIDTVEIDGNNYYVTQYSYKGAKLDDGTTRHEGGRLPAGDTTYPNLCQVYLKHNAGNEDMVAIDGNANGMLDILVLSQAIQADGFEASTDKTAAQVALDAGFGEATSENIKKWFGDVTPVHSVSTADELADALAIGGTVVLAGDIDMKDAQTTIPSGVTATIDLAGYDIEADYTNTTDKASAIFNVGKGASLTINGNGEVHATAAKTMNYVSAIINNLGEVVVNGGDYSMNYGSYQEDYLIPTIIDTNSNVGRAITTINGGTFTHTRNMFRNFAQPKRGENNATLIINGGTFRGEEDDYATIWNQKTSDYGVEGDGIVTINGGNFTYVEITNDFETGVTIAEGLNIKVAKEE